MGAPAVSAPARPARAPRSRPARRVSQPSKRTAAPRRAAAAPARRAPARRSPARRQQTPAGGVVMLPVHAVAGSAGIVSRLADSPLVVSMTRGRAWIAALGILLGGIVAINVVGLSMSASTSQMATMLWPHLRASRPMEVPRPPVPITPMVSFSPAPAVRA